MSELPVDEQRLQELLDRTLRDIPARRAPHGLAARVFAEIERRAAQPWWRQSFAHWPTLARAGFVVMCGVLIGLGLVGGHWTDATMQSLHASDALPLSSARHALTLFTAVEALITLLASIIPATWLYVALATGAVLYAVLFGLGAAAYRTLYLTPSNGR